jgi:hypothetical protein
LPGDQLGKISRSLQSKNAVATLYKMSGPVRMTVFSPAAGMWPSDQFKGLTPSFGPVGVAAVAGVRVIPLLMTGPPAMTSSIWPGVLPVAVTTTPAAVYVYVASPTSGSTDAVNAAYRAAAN